MRDYSGAYIITRGNRRSSGKQPHRRPSRGAGWLIAALLILTAGICCLVVFLPKITKRVGGGVNYHGSTFYLLAVAETDTRQEALMHSQNTIERGGAGYIYNDGKYRIVAAIYDRESDAKTLASVNDGAECITIKLAPSTVDGSDKALIEYLTGEWFAAVHTAATELDRGNIADAAAERAVKSALLKLKSYAAAAQSELLRNIIYDACEFSLSFDRSVVSYIRYIEVRAIVSVCEILLLL